MKTITSKTIKKRNHLPVLLTIAGSDSGGGAGIQADLKTFGALGTFGTSVITAVTCQNTMGVGGMQSIEPSIVAEQIEKIYEDFPVAAIKTGMLFSTEIIQVVRERWEKNNTKKSFLVIDPVMVSSSGHKLLKKEAEEELISFLSSGYLITPNLPEAELILACSIKTTAEMIEAAKMLYEKHQTNVLLKGGHLQFDEKLNQKNKKYKEDNSICIDVYYDGEKEELIRYPRLQTKNTHGSGCTLSAAIAACLGKGIALKEAIHEGRKYLQGAIKNAPNLGSGIGPLNHFWNINH